MKWPAWIRIWRRRPVRRQVLVFADPGLPSDHPRYDFAEISVERDSFKALLDDATRWRRVRAYAQADPDGKEWPGQAYVTLAVPDGPQAKRWADLDALALSLSVTE